MITQFFEGEYVGHYPVEQGYQGAEFRYFAIKNGLDEMLILKLQKSKQNNNLSLCLNFKKGDMVTAHYEVTQKSYEKNGIKQWITSLDCYKLENAL